MSSADQLIVRRFEGAQDRSVLQASDLSLETVASMVDSGAIDIQPQYQRRARWSPKKRSALIESFLLNIPVPPVYLAEDDYGVYSVIDGKQRLGAVRGFMRDDYALVQLDDFEALNGRRFTALPPELRNALSIRPYIRAITLLRQSDEDVKYEVFQRLNTGGEPLNAQEIRNSAFRGPLNDLLYALAEAPFLRKQLKIKSESSPPYRNMLDAEFVLRFLTLADNWASFSGDFKASMDAFMATHQYLGGPDVVALGGTFKRALQWCERLWGEHAFHRPEGSGWRDQALAGMYDAQMVAVSERSDAHLERLDGARVLSETRRLFADPVFDKAVREATNTPQRIKYRVSVLGSLLDSLGAQA